MIEQRHNPAFMLSLKDSCPECSGRIIDVGEELVCNSCGIVFSKEVIQGRKERESKAIDYIDNSLGSYLGPIDYGYEEIYSNKISDSSTFKYLKTVSDFTGRESGSLYTCIKTIERVCEKLFLPKIVMGQAVIIARKIFKKFEARSTAISVYSIHAACKKLGVSTVGLSDIIRAHILIGRKVKVSSLVNLYMESPVRQEPRNAVEYVPRVIRKLEAELLLSPEHARKLYELAGKIIHSAYENWIGGRSPYTIAATSVYAAEYALSILESRKRLFTQKQVAVLSGVAEYTVREQFCKIFKNLTLSMLQKGNHL